MLRSTYFGTLSGDVKRRYEEKIKIINNIDPYALSSVDLSLNPNKLPEVVMMDLVNYLILSHSFYTGQQLKAYKSLQAYKLYESGYVLNVVAKQMNDDAFIILAKVRHSQRTREKPLEPWLILLKDGSVSSAHCTCMAGLGEVCTHVAAVLFYLFSRPDPDQREEAGVACTSQLARWPVPPLLNVDMLRVRDMWVEPKVNALSRTSLPPMASSEMVDLVSELLKINISPAICRIMEPFASEFPTQDAQSLPDSLDCLYNISNATKTYDELLDMSKNIDVKITAEQIQTIEAKTRGQVLNTVWFKYRTGRVTASMFKSVCKTSISRPSLTVIKGICYPQKVIFNSKATSYGIKNENTAFKEYVNYMKNDHNNFSAVPVGFFISEQYPEVGASPDGLVSCDCCGSGCVEIKCPYLPKKFLNCFCRENNKL